MKSENWCKYEIFDVISGEICMRMACEDLAEKSRELTDRIRDLDHTPGKNCKCANIENEILLMAHDAYSKIRRADDSRQAFEQYQEEVNDTNMTIFDSMSILCSIKSLCKHGRTIEDMYPGSVVFVIKCPTTHALDDLWYMYKSGQIEHEVNADFLTPCMRRRHAAPYVRLKVVINEDDYLKTRKEIGKQQMSFFSLKIHAFLPSLLHYNTLASIDQ